MNRYHHFERIDHEFEDDDFEIEEEGFFKKIRVGIAIVLIIFLCGASVGYKYGIDNSHYEKKHKWKR